MSTALSIVALSASLSFAASIKFLTFALAPAFSVVGLCYVEGLCLLVHNFHLRSFDLCLVIYLAYTIKEHNFRLEVNYIGSSFIFSLL